MTERALHLDRVSVLYEEEHLLKSQTWCLNATLLVNTCQATFLKKKDNHDCPEIPALWLL